MLVVCLACPSGPAKKQLETLESFFSPGSGPDLLQWDAALKTGIFDDRVTQTEQQLTYAPPAKNGGLDLAIEDRYNA